jgi:hypothetical protein
MEAAEFLEVRFKISNLEKPTNHRFKLTPPSFHHAS